jgi:hypothetical protein
MWGGGRAHLVESRWDMVGIFQWMAVFLSLLYVGVYISYMVKVVMQSHFLYGFVRLEDLKTGNFVDDRYTFPWWFLLLNNLRILILPALLWVFQHLHVRGRYKLVLFLFQAFTILDLLLIIAWELMKCFTCNNGFFRNGLCDERNLTTYCNAITEPQPDICPTLAVNCSNSNFTGVVPDPCYIKPDAVYPILIYYTCGFLAIDFLLSIFLMFSRYLLKDVILALSSRARYEAMRAMQEPYYNNGEDYDYDTGNSYTPEEEVEEEDVDNNNEERNESGEVVANTIARTENLEDVRDDVGEDLIDDEENLISEYNKSPGLTREQFLNKLSNPEQFGINLNTGDEGDSETKYQ